MNVEDKNILVTGGANGIGRALCERFAADGARKVYVADVNEKNAQTVAEQIGGEAIHLDVADETNVKTAVEKITSDGGHLDIVCSNAGIGGAEGGLEVAFVAENAQVGIGSKISRKQEEYL